MVRHDRRIARRTGNRLRRDPPQRRRSRVYRDASAGRPAIGGSPMTDIRAGRATKIATVIWSVVIAIAVLVLGASIMLPSTKRARVDFNRSHQDAGAAETQPTTEPTTEPTTQPE